MRQASVPFKVRFAHVPSDGKTPVFNSLTDKWEYRVAPDATLVAASVSKLEDVGQKASTAFNKYEAVDLKATQAQASADLKVTAEEAVQSVQDSLFYVDRFRGGASDVPLWDNLRVELREDESERWYFIVHGRRNASTGDTNLYDIPLNYVTVDDFADLLVEVALLRQRVTALEKKLGIS